jgi:hypothetical protein
MALLYDFERKCTVCIYFYVNTRHFVVLMFWLWKERLNSDGQQFHQYQQNEQSPLPSYFPISKMLHLETRIISVWTFQRRMQTFMQKGRFSTFSWLWESKACNLTSRYIDDLRSINNPNCANSIPLIFSKELEIKETTKSDSLSHFLTFNSNMTPTLYQIKHFYILIVIYQTTTRMEFMFKSTYVALDLAVCIKTFYNVTAFKY